LDIGVVALKPGGVTGAGPGGESAEKRRMPLHGARHPCRIRLLDLSYCRRRCPHADTHVTRCTVIPSPALIRNGLIVTLLLLLLRKG